MTPARESATAHLPTKSEVNMEKQGSEDSKSDIKSAWEIKKLQAEVHSLRRPFTHPATIIALALAVGGVAQWFRSDRELQLAQIKTERLELESGKLEQKREALDKEVAARKKEVEARNLELLRIKDQIANAEATLHQGAVTAADAQMTKAQLQNAATSLQSLVSGSIGVTPSTIAPGETARLQWNSFDATEVRISPGIGYVSPSGSADVAPKETTTYRLILGNSRSATSASATVQVIGVKPVRGSGHQ